MQSFRMRFNQAGMNESRGALSDSPSLHVARLTALLGTSPEFQNTAQTRNSRQLPLYQPTLGALCLAETEALFALTFKFRETGALAEAEAAHKKAMVIAARAVLVSFISPGISILSSRLRLNFESVSIRILPLSWIKK